MRLVSFHGNGFLPMDLITVSSQAGTRQVSFGCLVSNSLKLMASI